MKKFSADYIFPVTAKPLKNGVVIIDDNGQVIDIVDNIEKMPNRKEVEVLEGVIVPGFVNCHCHLELSYLEGKIKKHLNHVEFINRIIKCIATEKRLQSKIVDADRLMQKEGIVAVADIYNAEYQGDVRDASPIYYHKLFEIADFFSRDIGNEKLKKAEKISAKNNNFSAVAHAPYTCSPQFIAQTAKMSKNIYSVHNQEAPTEDEMYLNASGKMFEMMKLKNKMPDFEPTKKTSLRSFLPDIVRSDLNILLIHNLYTSADDIKFAEALSDNIYWTLCPNSNLYIQNKLPDIERFIANNCKITLGTDSLATNDNLSILDEMKNFRNVDFSEVLKWATINGARALKIDDKFGSIEIGKTPGLNLIRNFDLKKGHININSTVERVG